MGCRLRGEHAQVQPGRTAGWRSSQNRRHMRHMFPPCLEGYLVHGEVPSTRFFDPGGVRIAPSNSFVQTLLSPSLPYPAPSASLLSLHGDEMRGRDEDTAGGRSQSATGKRKPLGPRLPTVPVFPPAPRVTALPTFRAPRYFRVQCLRTCADRQVYICSAAPRTSVDRSRASKTSRGAGRPTFRRGRTSRAGARAANEHSTRRPTLLRTHFPGVKHRPTSRGRQLDM